MDIVADIINGFVAVGTVAMAAFTALTVRAAKNARVDTNRALEAANRTARATEENVERMKDGLRPHLDLSVRISSEVPDHESAERQQTFNLIVRNSGSGPAIIRVLTHRDDIKEIRPWGSIPVATISEHAFQEEQISDLTIAPSENCIMRLPYKSDLYSEQYEMVSSISLFYSDVYDRLYRSRLLYLFWKRDGQECVVPLNREHMKVTSIPDLSEAGMAQEQEGGRPFQFVAPFQPLFLFGDSIQRVGTTIDSSEFTSNRRVKIMGIQLGNDGFPVIHAQIDGFPVFRLESLRTKQRVVRVQNLDGSKPENLNQFGFEISGVNDDENLLTLYKNLSCACLDVRPELLGPLFS